MQRVASIAFNTFSDAFIYRVLYNLIFFSLLLIATSRLSSGVRPK